MECVSSKPTYIDPMIVEDVTIETPIVKDFLVCRVAQILFEHIDCAKCFCVVVNEESRTVSKIDIWANEATCANNLSFSHWTLFLGVDANCLGIPCMHSVLVLLQDLYNFLCIFWSSDDGSAWNCESFQCEILDLSFVLKL
jgi:hypothetical protein